MESLRSLVFGGSGSSGGAASVSASATPGSSTSASARPSSSASTSRRTSGGSRGTTGKAVKWLGMKRAEGGAGERMFVGVEAATGVLEPLGDRPVNLISIFGAARQGKSFMMNLLADQQDLFKISNLREPCTQGVDLSGHLLPLRRFSAVNGCPAVTSKTAQDMLIGFVDAEGQGDRDITYDSRLVSPVLLTSKVVIFNWKDSLQADRILNLLAVLARAAQGIELGEDDGIKVFGHLHLVFRDWNFVNSTPEEVFNDLFKKEKGLSNEVNVRNAARTSLQEAFESINVWLFPPPVTNTANLREKIRFDQLQPAFQEKLCEFRTTVSQQLKEPTLFYRQPLTAKLLSDVMPVLVETLNSDKVIMPESIYSSMVRAQANAMKERCERAISDHIEATTTEEAMANDALEKLLTTDMELIITKALDGMTNVPSPVLKDIKDSLLAYSKKEIKLALHANNEKITTWVGKQGDAVAGKLTKECAALEKSSLPMKRDALREKWTIILHRELGRIEKMPIGLNGRRDIDRECSRIRQHSTMLYDKLEIANDRALQRSSAAMNDAIRAAKARLTKEVYDFLALKFAEKRATSIGNMLNELDVRLVAVKRDLARSAGVLSDLVPELEGEIDTHKTHLAEELNRRYFIEVQHILNEAGFNARDDLTREVSRRLDGKLPLLEEEIKKSIDEAVKVVKKMINDKLQGWTVLKQDTEAKSRELEKFADILTDQYLRRNRELEKDEDARREKEQYEKLRVKITQGFERSIKAIGLPMDEDKVESVFNKVLQDEAAQFLSFASNKTSFSIKELRESLTSDCRQTIETQKLLNRLASDKKRALDTAEQERRLREQEANAAREREREISELKNYVSKSTKEKETESKRLRDQLAEEEHKRRQYEQEMVHHQSRFAQLEAQKRDAELRAKEESLRDVQAREDEARRLKRELDEMKRRTAEIEDEKRSLERRLQMEERQKQSSDALKIQLEDMRIKAAEMELQQMGLELKVQEQAEARAFAEAAARDAARAAELSARAAIEAAGFSSRDDVRRKRYLSGGSEDVDMEEEEEALPPARAPERKKPRGPNKNRVVGGPSKHKAAGPTKKRMTLEEARKAAQEEVAQRVKARTQSLTASARKKK